MRASSKRSWLIALAACCCAIVLSGCGKKQNTVSPPAVKPFTVMLDSSPNADHASLYAAIAHGDFRAAGLDVRPQVPSDASTPLRLLAAGKVDMAISYEPEVLLARDRGLKVVSVAALVQRPLASIIALPDQHISSVKDLAGKRVGTAGIEYQSLELETALKHAGVNPSSVKQVNVGVDLVGAMLSGRVAATLGGFWNYQAIQLRLLHKHPVVIPVNRAGVPNYDELVLVVREGEARYHGQQVRSFLQALSEGERQVREDPSAAAKLVEKADRSLQPKLQVESIEQTLPAAKPAHGEPYGYQSPDGWASFGRWMYSQGMLQSDPDKKGLPPFTNEFLPGQGIGKAEEEEL